MKELFLAGVGIIGLYFILNWFTSLRSAVAFHAAGMTFTWFGILLVAGIVLILKLTLGK